MTGIIIFVGLLLALAGYVIGIYNKLVNARNKVENQFSQVDIQLKRRADLIPNLVETVKGYTKHEEEVLTKVTQLRTSWANASTVGEKAELSNELSGALKTIMAVSENYPDLKANQNFAQMQEELQNTENKVAYSRQFYNDTVTKYNTKLQLFPTSLIAGILHFTEEELFRVDSEETRQNVKVSFE